MSESTLRIGILMPEVLGTYGDGGNAVVLAHRAKLLGYQSEIVHVRCTEAIPESLDIYTLGGGEDVAQTIASRRLLTDRGLERAVQKQKPVLAICAAFQVLGTWYTDAEGRRTEGAGLLDVVTLPQGARAIGELINSPSGLPLERELSEPLTGFENHGGATLLGRDASPLGFVTSGIGNGQPGVAPGLADGASAAAGVQQGHEVSREIPEGYRATEDGKAMEGCVQGSIIATYLHGPCLARNPQLADLLLARALGIPLPLAVPEIPGLQRLRQERLAAIK
ncbi:type 1 glutamine amidotransferase [Mobiluncus curtisii]|uniref:Lipid II isoglutaminyl synthase (glutamine-hydrolyzing) subunit GatD n=1 Tax=Mobiluncus curtisii ATCC 51333 TaxID=887326 RepID=E6LVY9_9ACTO|nr:glutamine amidotransferase [Mobiluncus curtisii]EFU80874.1 CobB/CobQ-like protein [Mobiluncus curtisii ATCC 51333]